MSGHEALFKRVELNIGIERMSDESRGRLPVTALNGRKGVLMELADAEALLRLARVHQARERIAWRPVETAPLDYDEVLLLDKDGEVWLANYEPRAEVPYWNYDTFDLTPDRHEVKNPTHWMPLPDALARIKELGGKT